jgi:hypothetical protein
MNGIPWWLAVPAVIALVIAAGFGVLAVWIRWNGPAVGARWHAAVEAENARSRIPEEVTR